ncbi:MAG: hydantoinase/oxoprolinase family protein [Solirubrobacteraceae bacterium]
MNWAIGVDIGGTFTDCVGIDPDGRLHHAKALSTHDGDVSEGVIEALDELATGVGMTTRELLAQTGRVGHGTTIGTNLLVERRGARVALVTTAGHADALSMMRGAGRTAGLPIERVFDVRATSKPAPLVPRSQIAELHERIAADGAVVAPLDEARARDTLAALLGESEREGEGEVEGVAIMLLWSLRNDAHERRVAELVHELAPDAFVTLSSQAAPRQGEYERAVAAVINSYVGPSSVAYLDELAGRLQEAGFDGELLVMQANGGVADVAHARAKPIGLIGSGPAGGISGVAVLAARAGHPNVIATDMGGTSFEVGLLLSGRPLVSGQQIVEQHTFHQPHLDARSIACGGGSIASLSPDGGLRVGPHSAGSNPGPAAYGRGGREPTVTDADVVLGFLSPEAFLGGGMQLDPKAARAAVAAIAEPLELGVEEAAAGILRINNHAAATLIRQRTLEQGLDPRDFIVYAYGGAGPLHAWGFAAELGCSRVVIPLGNGAATLSAYGIAAGDLVQHHEVECRARSPIGPAELAGAVEQAEAAARAAMPGETPQLGRVALMRYAEQLLQSVPVRIPDGPIDEAACAQLLRDFDAEYERQFGAFAKALFQAVEVFAVRIEERVAGELPDLATIAPDTEAAARETRRVHWPEHGPLETAIFDGGALAAGQRIDGPAVIELPYTTVPVAPGQRLERDADNDNLLLELEV